MAKGGGCVIEVRVPKFGMSTVEVDIMAVFVTAGNHVNAGDPLVEIESEKATMVIESEHAGVVREVLVAEDDISNVGDVICRLDLDA